MLPGDSRLRGMAGVTNTSALGIVSDGWTNYLGNAGNGGGGLKGTAHGGDDNRGEQQADASAHGAAREVGAVTALAVQAAVGGEPQPGAEEEADRQAEQQQQSTGAGVSAGEREPH